MKKYLIIYKRKDNKEITRTDIAPSIIKRNGKEITVDKVFLEKHVSEFNDEYITVSYIELADELDEIITFLRKDRTRSINEQLTALKEASDTLDDIYNDVYRTIGNIERDFKKQIENEK